MVNEELVNILAIYKPRYLFCKKKGPVLELRGNFNREAIDYLISSCRPLSASPEYAPGKGQARFLVNNEQRARELAIKLDDSLREYGFSVNFSNS